MRIIVRFILIGYLFCSTSLISAQKQYAIDSLTERIKSTSIDSVKVDLLIEIGTFFVKKDPDVGINFLTQALQLAESVNYNIGICQSSKYLGDEYRAIGKHQATLDYLNKSLSIEQNNNYLLEAGNCFNFFSGKKDRTTS